MLVPSLPGWKVETVGDDICWMHVGDDGRLWAINPEAGMFGVAPGTSTKTNPNAHRVAHARRHLHQRRAARRRTPWWEGLSNARATTRCSTDWRGSPWTHGRARHRPRIRTLASRWRIAQCPSVGQRVDDPRGVPISAIVFGGRRAKLAPLVYEATSWHHGVYVGATMVSRDDRSGDGRVGVPRNDPMAMLPFCGYNMARLLRPLAARSGKRSQHPPKIFHVNWFRTDEQGKFLWPGFGDNIRVIDWMMRRVGGQVGANASPLGLLPKDSDLNVEGLSLTPKELDELLKVDWNAWLDENARTLSFFDKFGSRMPAALLREHAALEARLRDAQA